MSPVQVLLNWNSSYVLKIAKSFWKSLVWIRVGQMESIPIWLLSKREDSTQCCELLLCACSAVGAPRGRELAWRKGEAAVFGLAGHECHQQGLKAEVSSELGCSLWVLEEVMLHCFWLTCSHTHPETTAQLLSLEKTSGRPYCRGPVTKGSYKNDEEGF